MINQVLDSPAFQQSQRVSVYLSTDSEVSTVAILSEIFRQNKKVSKRSVLHIFELIIHSRKFLLGLCAILQRKTNANDPIAWNG